MAAQPVQCAWRHAPAQHTQRRAVPPCSGDRAVFHDLDPAGNALDCVVRSHQGALGSSSERRRCAHLRRHLHHGAHRGAADNHPSGLAEEAAAPPDAADSTASDVDVTAEDVDADEAGELDSSATNVLKPDGDMPLLPDDETTSRLLPVDLEDVVVARRPRWRAASLLSGLTCEGRHVTPEWPTPHPCGRFTSCPLLLLSGVQARLLQPA